MIYVVDECMGRGKTSAAINYIKDNPDKHFIYITPYLSEVERMVSECGFKQPVKYNDNYPKILHLKEMLNHQYNIATTHVMFHLFDDEIINLCQVFGYELIMDEVTEVVVQHKMEKKDLDILLQEFVDVDDDGKLTWRENSENTNKFADEKRLCNLGCLAVYSDIAIVWLFPLKVFEAFSSIYILTYMFNAQPQRYYYDYYDVQYEYMHVAGKDLSSYCFSKNVDDNYVAENYGELINIFDDEKLNYVGNDKYALSKTWYDRNKDNNIMQILKNNLNNYFRKKNTLWRNNCYVPSSSDNNIWTTFSEYEKSLSGKGYAKGFAPCNARATNEYRDRTVVAYMVNRFFNPVIKNFFMGHNIDIDEDAYALSEMLQFVWRSGIRDGKHITIYVPSKRMRELLVGWMSCHSAT